MPSVTDLSLTGFSEDFPCVGSMALPACPCRGVIAHLYTSHPLPCRTVVTLDYIDRRVIAFTCQLSEGVVSHIVVGESTAVIALSCCNAVN